MTEAAGVRIRIGARQLSRRFGPVVAVDRVDLAVAPGTIHAVVGGNGAGKSTLMRILQGVDRPDEGSVILNDAPVRLTGPGDAFARGIGMVHQEFMLAPPLTLLENLILAHEPLGRGGLIDWRAARAEAERLAKIAGVAIDWRSRVSDAPVRVRQVLEILRLLYRGVDVLILDEPTAVLAPAQVTELIALMRRLKGEGRTILFISHKLDEVMRAADAITVMRAGRVVATTTPAETDKARLARAMVGEAVEPARIETRARRAAAPLFAAKGLVARDPGGVQRLGPIDLEVHAGEIVGVAGVSGNGQDELVASAAGLRPIASGTIVFAGTPITNASTGRFRSAGIGYLSADRAEEGLCLVASIRDNFVAGREGEAPFSRRGFLRPTAIDDSETLHPLSAPDGRGAQPLRRQSAARRHRPRIRPRAEAARRGATDARGRHIRHRLHSSADRGVSRSRRRRVADLRGDRRNPRALRSHHRALWRRRGRRTRTRRSERRESGTHDARPKGGVMVAAFAAPFWRAAAAAAPFALAACIGAAVLAATGHNPLAVYRLMVEEAFGGQRRIAATLTAATPLLLTGLAAAIAFRAGIFNVGAEGCFYLGGLVAAVLGYVMAGWPSILLIPIALGAAAIVGGVWLIGPALARTSLGVDEVVTTLMLNFIAVDITSWLVNGPLLARGSANSATLPIGAGAELPRLLPPTTLHLGFVISLALVALFGLWERLTAPGLRSQMVGLNPRFSRAVGIDVPATLMSMMIASGLIGGLAGAIHVLGLVHRFVAGFSPGYGFTGIAIAVLGRNSAIGVAVGAVLFGALSSAGATIQLFSDVPIEIVEILQGAVMIFAVAKFGAGRRRGAAPA